MRTYTDIALDIQCAAIDLWLDGFDSMTVEDIHTRIVFWDTDAYHAVFVDPRGVPHLTFKWPEHKLDVTKLVITLDESGKRDLVRRLYRKLNRIDEVVRKPI